MQKHRPLHLIFGFQFRYLKWSFFANGDLAEIRWEDSLQLTVDGLVKRRKRNRAIENYVSWHDADSRGVELKPKLWWAQTGYIHTCRSSC